MGSADLMHRNLDRRVEALVQVTDPTAQTELRRVFEISLRDDVRGFDLSGDGVWHRRMAIDDGVLEDPQELLLRRALGRPE
jgi:polyphosphate kinase